MSIYDNLGQPHTGQSYMLVMVIGKKCQMYAKLPWQLSQVTLMALLSHETTLCLECQILQ